MAPPTCALPYIPFVCRFLSHKGREYRSAGRILYAKLFWGVWITARKFPTDGKAAHVAEILNHSLELASDHNPSSTDTIAS